MGGRESLEPISKLKYEVVGWGGVSLKGELAVADAQWHVKITATTTGESSRPVIRPIALMTLVRSRNTTTASGEGTGTTSPLDEGMVTLR